MFLDASAIVAILGREPDAAELAARLARASEIYVSPLSLYEAVLGLARLRGLALADAHRLVGQLVEDSRAKLIAIDGDIGRGAVDAFARFGKGRHAANLNLGDCFAYACARQLDVPLLCKGDDFTRTDVTLA